MPKSASGKTHFQAKNTVDSGTSQNQQHYLKAYQHRQRLVFFWRFFLFVFFLVLWEVSSRRNWIDSFIFSSPSLILKNTIIMFQKQDLLSHIRITLLETLCSFLLVTGISLLLSLFLWAFPHLSEILEPYLITLNSLPKSALAPLLIVWLGANTTTIIVSGISVAVFGAVINLYTGFRETDPETCKLIQTFGGGKPSILLKVILPSSIPMILSVMKVNIGLCLVGVVIGEFIGARKGLGYLIIYGSQTFKLTWVLMSILILCVIAICLYALIGILEKKLRSRYH